MNGLCLPIIRCFCFILFVSQAFYAIYHKLLHLQAHSISLHSHLISAMASPNQQDCFAVFGPCHRRQIASISSFASSHSGPRTDASTISGRSSRCTSITDIDPKTYTGALPKPPAINRITLTTYTLQYARAGQPHHTNDPSRPRHRHIRHLSHPSPSHTGSRPDPELPAGSPELNSLRDLLGRTKKLLVSCCLVDARRSNRPLVVSTDDGISAHIQPDVLPPRRTRNTGLNSSSFQSLTSPTGCQNLYLLLQRPVISLATSATRVPNRTPFSLVARVDITGLVAPHGFRETVADVWLDVAADAMRALAPQKPHLLRYLPDTHALHTIPDLQRPVERINALYDAFVIIEPASGPTSALGSEAAAYEVTYVSNVQDSEVRQKLENIAKALHAGEYKLARLFARGYRFIFDARLDLAAPHEFVWCVPMAGNGLKCWVGFLMSSLA